MVFNGYGKKAGTTINPNVSDGISKMFVFDFIFLDFFLIIGFFFFFFFINCEIFFFLLLVFDIFFSYLFSLVFLV
jgi:hypothetical protein